MVRKLILGILLVLLFVFPAHSATYWVDDTGTEAVDKTNCDGATPIDGATACTLAFMNAEADDNDIVYLREGTYTITDKGINPTNSGSAGNIITFSGYASEVATIYGDATTAGYDAVGIYLSADDYIKVTKLVFSNVNRGLELAAGADHNEISYNTFTMRTRNADVFKTGTADNGAGDCTAYANSVTVLCDTSNDFSGLTTNKSLVNITDNSQSRATVSSTTTTITSTDLEGGTNAYWSNGDSYKIIGNPVNDPAAMDIGGDSTHNWIHHNTISHYGAYLHDSDSGILFVIGFSTNSAEENSNNTVEYNHIYHGGHHVFGVSSGFYNVIRNNYLHNEGWWDDTDILGVCAAGDNGLCGYRVMRCEGAPAHVGYTLYEGNFIGYGAQYGAPHIDTGGGSGNGWALSNPNNIVRYNSIVANAQYGLSFASSQSGSSGVEEGDNNKVYNNTFLSNGWNWPSEDDPSNSDTWRTGIHFYNSTSGTGNVIKNNLFHSSWAGQTKLLGSNYYPDINAVHTDNIAANTISNNYTTDATYITALSKFADTADPLFVNETLPSTSAEIVAAWSNYTVTSPDLNIAIGSPVKDQGTHLTTVAEGDDSSGTTLVLTDASYFQDGTWGSSLADLGADWICVGATVAAADCFQISAISTNDVTVAAFERVDGDLVWLYKDSKGVVVLFGAAPDYGAFENFGNASTGITMQ